MYQRRQGAVKGRDHEDAEPPDTQTIVIEDEGLRAGFTQLPNYVFRIRGLSHGAKLTYALLLSYAWQKDSCFPGQATLADDLDVSVRSVSDYLRELQERALIRVQRRGLGKTNVYHILRLEAAPGPGSRAPTPVPIEQIKPAAAGSAPSGKHASALQGHGSPRDRQLSASPDRQDSADPHAKQSADPGRQPVAVTETRKAAAKKHQGRERHSPTERDTAQQRAAAVDLARTVLARWGIAEQALVDELCTAPSEVVRQAAALDEHLAAGRRIASPAGWLIQAVRACYRRPAEGAEGATPGFWPPSAGSAGGPYGRLALLEDAESAEDPADGREATATGWEAIKRELRETVTAANYRRWFAPLVVVRDEPHEIVLATAGERERDWLDKRLRAAVERSAASVLGYAPALSFVVAAEDDAGFSDQGRALGTGEA